MSEIITSTSNNDADTFDEPNEINDKMPGPMIIKQEDDDDDIEFQNTAETEIEMPTENEFQIQNHFQIVSVKSLHPLEQFTETNNEEETNRDDEHSDINIENQSTIQDMLQDATSQNNRIAFGIATIDQHNSKNIEDEDNSLLVEAKTTSIPKRGRRPIIKKTKSKLDIFRKRLGVSHLKPHQHKDDDFTMDDEISNDDDQSNVTTNEQANFLLLDEQQHLSGTGSSFNERSTRRKSIHKPYDIAMEIVDDAVVKRDRLNQVRSIKNPHVDYIKKASQEHLEKHYADLSARPFFPGLVKYMASGPVVPMVWEGLGAVKTGRVLLGATNPTDSAPGTIRGDLCVQVGRNIIHGSDAVESANKEIALWFTDKELVQWTPAVQSWVYDD